MYFTVGYFTLIQEKAGDELGALCNLNRLVQRFSHTWHDHSPPLPPDNVCQGHDTPFLTLEHGGARGRRIWLLELTEYPELVGDGPPGGGGRRAGRGPPW